MKFTYCEAISIEDFKNINSGDITFTSFITNDYDFVFLKDHIYRFIQGVEYLNKLKGKEVNKLDLVARCNDFLYEYFEPQCYFRYIYHDDVFYLASKKHIYSSSEVSLKSHKDSRSNEFPSFIKHGNYKDGQTLRNLANLQGYDDVLYVSEKGIIREAVTSNILFINQNNEVITPKYSSYVFEGVTLKNILLLLERENFKIRFEDININNLNDYSECFILNAIEGLRKVTRIDNTFFKSEINYNMLLSKFGRFGVRDD